jgi:YVTN family beta-propeller protein
MLGQIPPAQSRGMPSPHGASTARARKQPRHTLPQALCVVMLALLAAVVAPALALPLSASGGPAHVAASPLAALPTARDGPGATASASLVPSTTSPPEWEAGSVVATIPGQDAPYALAYDSANGNIYAPNAGSYRVNVISGTTNAEVASIPVGVEPQSIAYDSTNGDLYVSETGSNNVTVINGATNTVVPTGASGIPVGTGPLGIAFDSGNGCLYVANDGTGNTVSVINGATNTIVTTITVTGASSVFWAAYDSANGYVYVTDIIADEVFVINGATNALVGSPIPVGTEATGILYDPSNGYLYVANFGGSSVTVINGATNTVVGSSISVGTDPEFFAYNNANGAIYVGNVVSVTVSEISDVTDTVVATIGSAQFAHYPRGLAFDPETGFLYTGSDGSTISVFSTLLMVGPATPTLRGVATSGENSATLSISTFPDAYDSGNGDLYGFTGNNVTVLSGTSGAPVATIAVGTEPDALAYDSGNGGIYVANWGSDNVSVIAGATNTVTDTILLPASSLPTGIAYDAGNGAIYIANRGLNTVTVISGATNSIVATISVGMQPWSVAYDSENGAVYVANAGGGGMVSRGSVSVIDSATNLVVATIPVGNFADGAAFDASNGDIYVANEATNNVSVISGATNTVVATVAVGALPIGVTYDSANQEVYVADSNALSFPPGPGYVSVINGATNALVASIPVGSAPVTDVYDNQNGDVYVGNEGSNNISVIATLSDAEQPVNPALDVGQTLLVSAPLGGEGSGQLSLSIVSSDPSGLACTPDVLGATDISGACRGQTPGVYTVTLEVSDSVANSVQSTLAVSVDSDPIVAAPSATPTAIDVGQSTVFTTTASGGIGGYGYSWDGLPAGCVGGNSASTVCTPTSPGSFAVSVGVVDSNGFAVSSSPTTLVVSPAPSIGAPTASPSSVDVGQSTQLTATLASPGSGTDTYAWIGLPGGSGCPSSDALSTTCAPATAGTYTVIVRTTDSNGVTVNSTALTLVVSPALGSATLTASASTVTVGGYVEFSASVTGGSGIYSYLWSGLPAGCPTANSAELACAPSATTGSPFTVSVKITDSNGASVTATSSAVTVKSSGSSSSGTTFSTADWAAIALAIVAVAIAAVAIVLSGRRKGGGGSTSLPPPAAASGGPPPAPWAEPPSPGGPPPSAPGR